MSCCGCLTSLGVYDSGDMFTPFIAKAEVPFTGGNTVRVRSPGNTISWGDGTPPYILPASGSDLHVFNTQGTYFIQISGGGNELRLAGDSITEVIDWGTYPITALSLGLDPLQYPSPTGCFNLATVPPILPASVTDISFMFYAAPSFNQDISTWDVSNVTDMHHMFETSAAFNRPIGGWNVSNVVDMSFMFSSASDFNQDITTWNVGSVTNMRKMFVNALVFNKAIGGWSVSNVTDMSAMFANAQVFNQDLSGWCVSGVTTHVNFDQNTSAWVLPKPNFSSPPC